MPSLGSKQHEKALMHKVKELCGKGWKVIVLGTKSPDAIAIKDDKLFAVEVLGTTNKVLVEQKYDRFASGLFGAWHKTDLKTMDSKRQRYQMFDGVIFRLFTYEKDSHYYYKMRKLVKDFG